MVREPLRMEYRPNHSQFAGSMDRALTVLQGSPTLRNMAYVLDRLPGLRPSFIIYLSHNRLYGFQHVPSHDVYMSEGEEAVTVPHHLAVSERWYVAWNSDTPKPLSYIETKKLESDLKRGLADLQDSIPM